MEDISLVSVGFDDYNSAEDLHGNLKKIEEVCEVRQISIHIFLR